VRRKTEQVRISRSAPIPYNYDSYNRPDNHENGSGDNPGHAESTDEITAADIPGDGNIAPIYDDNNDDTYNEHMETAYETTAEDIVMDTNADGWDAPTKNEEDTLLAVNDDITRVGGDNDVTRDASETEIQASMDERHQTRSGHYNLRPRRERNTNGCNALLVNTSMIQDDCSGQETILTQYNVKQGRKIFGKAGELVMSTELEQVHSRKVIKPKHPHELSSKERADALPYLMS